ncbi:hypothetical protein V8J82_03400 [Gymnodinialimonas sp. 2305UL16-5]|uniref:hypothetical protein n=1 Tax=Gymnodinialimonas mytili TaxID=3126503 RepID=UPI0030A7D483
MIGAFRRRLAGLRCPRCGAGDVRFPVKLSTLPALYHAFWPLMQAQSAKGLGCRACDARLVCTARPRIFWLWGAVGLASMVVYVALVPNLVPSGVFSGLGFLAGLIIFDPLIARFSLILETV